MLEVHMPDAPKREGPRFLRILVIVFSCILGVLVYWLLGFVFDDIDTLSGPDYAAIELTHLDRATVQQEAELDGELTRIRGQMAEVREKQALLRESTSTSQQTLNQLLEMQRLYVQKGVRPSEAELKAFTDSQQLFLSSQRQFETYTEELGRLREQEKEVQSRRNAIDESLAGQRVQAQKEFQHAFRRHELLKAALKLLVLIPLVLIAARFFVTKRSSLLAPVIFACGIAILVKLVLVIHEYFPTRYFKYVVLLFAIGVVVQVLVYLIRVIASPKKLWLLRQYREAYYRFSCPVCAYPIRRGPLKYVLLTRQAWKRLAGSGASGPVNDDPYACPSCGTMLYEACASCHATRHSLLPFCEKCGAAKEIAAPASV
jgi:predicted RNA-binding Zn-ribbon protein involved in translation (DUF1610 family)